MKLWLVVAVVLGLAGLVLVGGAVSMQSRVAFAQKSYARSKADAAAMQEGLRSGRYREGSSWTRSEAERIGKNLLADAEYLRRARSEQMLWYGAGGLSLILAAGAGFKARRTRGVVAA
jgi:hypothetical protein